MKHIRNKWIEKLWLNKQRGWQSAADSLVRYDLKWNFVSNHLTHLKSNSRTEIRCKQHRRKLPTEESSNKTSFQSHNLLITLNSQRIDVSNRINCFRYSYHRSQIKRIILKLPFETENTQHLPISLRIQRQNDHLLQCRRNFIYFSHFFELDVYKLMVCCSLRTHMVEDEIYKLDLVQQSTSKETNFQSLTK